MLPGVSPPPAHGSSLMSGTGGALLTQKVISDDRGLEISVIPKGCLHISSLPPRREGPIPPPLCTPWLPLPCQAGLEDPQGCLPLPAVLARHLTVVALETLMVTVQLGNPSTLRLRPGTHAIAPTAVGGTPVWAPRRSGAPQGPWGRSLSGLGVLTPRLTPCHTGAPARLLLQGFSRGLFPTPALLLALPARILMKYVLCSCSFHFNSACLLTLSSQCCFSDPPTLWQDTSLKPRAANVFPCASHPAPPFCLPASLAVGSGVATYAEVHGSAPRLFCHSLPRASVM